MKQSGINFSGIPKQIGSVLPDWKLIELLKQSGLQKQIDRVQPCSVDLKVGDRLYDINGMPALSDSNGFDPDIVIKEFAGAKFGKSQLVSGVPLKRRNAYLVELDWNIKLGTNQWGYANPKSSAGRTDCNCIVLAKGSTEFNVVPRGYQGKLYMVIIPQSFPVIIFKGTSLTQLRVCEGDWTILSNLDLSRINEQHMLVLGNEEPIIEEDRLILRLDLMGCPSNLVALNRGENIPLNASGDIDPTKFFYKKELDHHDGLWLEPNEFALLRTIETVSIPHVLCAEMEPHNLRHGELRTHYAGFFDPGFSGIGVLEVRNQGSVPIRLEHGQRITRLQFVDLYSPAKTPYGSDKLGSNYQTQHQIRLAKYFKPWPVVAT